MKNKYDLAIKYYTETENYDQLKLAYEEMEQFNQTYESFFYYLKIDNKTLQELINKSFEKMKQNVDVKINEDISTNPIKNNCIKSSILEENTGLINNEYNENNSSSNIGDLRENSKINNEIYNNPSFLQHQKLYNTSKEQFIKIIKLYQLKISETIFAEAQFNSELLNYTTKKFKVQLNELTKSNKTVIANNICIDKKIKEDFSTQISCILLFLLLLFSFSMIYIQNYFYNLSLTEHIKNHNIVQ